MSKRIRIIPALLLMNEGLYKTVGFKDPAYVGDPINTVKIFNEKEADELVLVDITVSRDNKPINYKKIAEIAGEAFMPMAYGGGIRSFDDACKVFDAGFEKVIINSAAVRNPDLLGAIARVYGSQAVVVSMDVRPNWLRKYKVFTLGGTQNTNLSPEVYARQVESAGAGEIFLQAIHKDGTWGGYDIPLIKMVSDAVNIPVVACGGAGNIDDFKKAVIDGGASAVAAGSMFVYQKKGMGVLITFPTGDNIRMGNN
ncbi:imidazole glycerol phosphate synthase subunit HisF [Niastella vici]|uniref:imidazole glycerol-phosphate synthase n=1 Tax=Niastella vici TaxID=1703345 RepID=A0A1V9G8I2_9BACT|nr:AglZ/HisF2 family acetamidino modification protein [Niastella vici]OQP66892.1 imidazole glycerol phosphate synthase subunit HisF [Niastella vici]